MRSLPVLLLVTMSASALADEAPQKWHVARGARVKFGLSAAKTARALGVKLTVDEGTGTARVLLGGVPADLTADFGDDDKLRSLAVVAPFADGGCPDAFNRAYHELALALGQTDESTAQAIWMRKDRKVLLACDPGSETDAELDLEVTPPPAP